MTIADLSIKFDSAPLQKGVVDLDKLTAAAGRSTNWQTFSL